MINTSQLCNHTKYVDSQHENHVDNTKLAIEDLCDDMRVVQAGSFKVLQDVQHELSKPEKVGSMNYT